MTLTYLKKNNFRLLLLIVLLFPVTLLAQSANSVSLSVTPTLFEMAANPQQVWNSNVKVINNNPYTLTVYANAVNFAPQGETGQGKFIPVFETVTEGATLAEWIDITTDPIVLAPGESRQVPFTVRVPEAAAPGGHFAAITVGTRPPDDGSAFQIKTAQVVTSLFFVRISGDVIESGDVREFRTDRTFYSEPAANFSVRFENKGNVHIQPQGQITITNMWGKERGVIPINHRTHFGNVLPNSIRNFEFGWRGELDFNDIGRYTAELAIAYGSENRKFVTSRTYFWVIPVKPLLTILGIIIFIILFSMWAVRAYVRHMLSLQGYEPIRTPGGSFKRQGDVLIERRSVAAPVRAGWFDLRERLRKTKAFTDTLRAMGGFVLTYKLFFGAALVTVVLVVLIGYFISAVFEDTRDYEVIIENPNADVTISSEEILYEQRRAEADTGAPLVSGEASQIFTLTIINSSDTPGLAARVQETLEGEYEVSQLRSDLEETRDRSVIVYHPALQEEALALRGLLGDFILSALPPDQEAQEITIFIGNDYQTE